MKTTIILSLLLLSGCGSYLADKEAKQACQGYAQGSPEYAQCYAVTYSNARQGLREVGAAAVIAKPFQPQPAAPVQKPVTCVPVGGVVTCY